MPSTEIGLVVENNIVRKLIMNLGIVIIISVYCFAVDLRNGTVDDAGK